MDRKERQVFNFHNSAWNEFKNNLYIQVPLTSQDQTQEEDTALNDATGSEISTIQGNNSEMGRNVSKTASSMTSTDAANTSKEIKPARKFLDRYCNV